jgi:hypothetical protein
MESSGAADAERRVGLRSHSAGFNAKPVYLQRDEDRFPHGWMWKMPCTVDARVDWQWEKRALFKRQQAEA